MDTPLMIVLAGPDGAGKTTFYFNELEPNYPNLPFVNADIIQHREMKNPDMAASYVASKMAAERRQYCFDHRQSFIWESTFSHPSKPELIHRARDAGYQVEVIHIGVQSADICLERVAQRLSEGGHNVPEQKIIERFVRNKPLIREAIMASSNASVYDNSINYEEPVEVLAWERGKIVHRADGLPEWITELYKVNDGMV